MFFSITDDTLAKSLANDKHSISINYNNHKADADKVVKEIKESIFYKALDEEAENDYKNLKSYNKKIEDSDIVKTHNRYNKLHLKESN